VNIGYEVFDSDPAPGRIAAYRPDRDNVSLTPGVVLHREPWHYALAVSLRSTVEGHGRQFVSLLPSVSWEVPPRYTRFTSGRWVAGLGYEAIFYDEGVENRVVGRLKWEVDWRRAVRAMGDSVRRHLPWSNGTGSNEQRADP
jgi:hypothetical protein